MLSDNMLSVNLFLKTLRTHHELISMGGTSQSIIKNQIMDETNISLRFIFFWKIPPNNFEIFF
jgi:hypothetical protein